MYNVRDVQIRSTRFAGNGVTCRFQNCTRLLLEGCKFDSRALLVRHRKRARFKKTKILKCDFYSKYLLFESPERGKDRVTLDNCFLAATPGSNP